MTSISKKRKFVSDGVFYAEINEFFQRELGEDGYSGVEVRVTPMRTEIIIRATRTQSVLGDKGRRIRELTSLVQKRFNFPEGNVELYAERVQNRALCAIAQAESLRYKLLGGLAVRRACYGVLRYIMENGAKGVELTINGKLRGQRAKGMKFKDGYMIKSGHAVTYYVDEATRHILLKQGVLGIKVKIMLPYDPTGKNGPKKNMSDVITIESPKTEEPLPLPPKQGFAQNVNVDQNQGQQTQDITGQDQDQQQGQRQQQGQQQQQQSQQPGQQQGGQQGGQQQGGDQRKFQQQGQQGGQQGQQQQGGQQQGGYQRRGNFQNFRGQGQGGQQQGGQQQGGQQQGGQQQGGQQQGGQQQGGF